MCGLLLIVMKEVRVFLNLDEFIESSLFTVMVHDRLGVTKSIPVSFFNVCRSKEPVVTRLDGLVDIL